MRNKVWMALAGAAVAVALASPAYAASASLKFTKPENKEDTTVTINEIDPQGNTVGTASATIKPGMSAEKKRDEIKKALEAQGFTVTSTGTPPQDPGIIISALTSGRKIEFKPGKTGEKEDTVKAKDAHMASISFDGSFPSTDWNGEPALFTAGVQTDLGVVQLEYQAVDVPEGSEIDGASLAARFFGGLQAAASDIGADLTLDGSTIQVSFQSGTTSAAGGVIFGTTSPGGGLSGGTQTGGLVRSLPRF